MAPSLESSTPSNATVSSKAYTPTNILHRTPWQPPVAVSAEGSYIRLEDGTNLLDGVGGAAVACLGNTHPTVMQAIKDQVDKVSCEPLSTDSMGPAFLMHNKNYRCI